MADIKQTEASGNASLEIDNDRKGDAAAVERVLSAPELEKDHMNYDRVDKELAKYADAVAIEITPDENKRLRKMIDRRVLSIMVFTYFLQALDKGTLSFSSIMGIQKDAHLHGQQVNCKRHAGT
jgi:hypothetical protein